MGKLLTLGEWGGPDLRPAIVASSADPEVIALFWRKLLKECDDTVVRYEASGERVLAELERSERDRLYRIAPLFGGEAAVREPA